MLSRCTEEEEGERERDSSSPGKEKPDAQRVGGFRRLGRWLWQRRVRALEPIPRSGGEQQLICPDALSHLFLLSFPFPSACQQQAPKSAFGGAQPAGMEDEDFQRLMNVQPLFFPILSIFLSTPERRCSIYGGVCTADAISPCATQRPKNGLIRHFLPVCLASLPIPK